MIPTEMRHITNITKAIQVSSGKGDVINLVGILFGLTCLEGRLSLVV